jgi:hypothetical protein
MNHVQANSENFLFAQPRQPVADLRDFLDIVNGPGAWTPRSSTPGSGTDCRPAADAALDALTARYGKGTLLIPPAAAVGGHSWRFASGFTASKLCGHMVEGNGSQSSWITLDNNAARLFHFLPSASGRSGGGVKGIGGFLEEGYATSTSEVLRLEASASHAPDQTIFEDMYFSRLGTSMWGTLLTADGQPRTSPQGIRIVTMKNIQLFCGRLGGALFYNCVGFSIDNLGTYSGTGAGNDVYISGGGSASTDTVQFEMRGLTCSGQLSLSNATKVGVWGNAATVVGAATFNYHTGVVFSGAALSGSVGAKGDFTVVS